MVGEKNQKTILWHMKITWNSISSVLNKVLLGHKHQDIYL